jgi:hypothetical protein
MYVKRKAIYSIEEAPQGWLIFVFPRLREKQKIQKTLANFAPLR